MGCTLVSILLEWGGMLFGLCDYDHAAHVLEQEFAYLGDNFTMTLLGVSAEDAALRVIHFFQDGLVAQPPAQGHVSPKELLSVRFWSQLTANWPFYRNAVVYVLMVTGIRKKVILVAVAAAVVLPMLIRWEIATILAIGIAIGVGWLIIRKTSSNRAGKPLYYHLHIRIWRSGRFIQPARRYQRERNHGCP